MRANVLEIPIVKREKSRKLELDISFREAISEHLRRRWPSGTAKEAARRYELSLDRAREAAAGRASLTTIERIFKVDGWSAYLAVGAGVLGHTVTAYLMELRASHENDGKRLAALIGDSWPWRPPGPDDPGLVDLPEAGRGFPMDRRVGEG